MGGINYTSKITPIDRVILSVIQKHRSLVRWPTERNRLEFFDRDIQLGKLRRYEIAGIKHTVELILDGTKEYRKKCVLCEFGGIYRNITVSCSQCNVPLCITPFL